MRVRTVFFDFGGTLAHPLGDPLDLWLQFAAREGAVVARSELEPVHAEATARFTPTLYDHRGRMHEFWTSFDGCVLERIGIADPGGRIAEAIYRGFRDEM